VESADKHAVNALVSGQYVYDITLQEGLLVAAAGPDFKIAQCGHLDAPWIDSAILSPSSYMIEQPVNVQIS
jgi:hypothetical protein